jgi:hypothetical protein
MTSHWPPKRRTVKQQFSATIPAVHMHVHVVVDPCVQYHTNDWRGSEDGMPTCTPRRMMATLDLIPGFLTKYESHASRYVEGLGSRFASSPWSSSFSRCSSTGLIRDSTVSSPFRSSRRLSALKPVDKRRQKGTRLAFIGATDVNVAACKSAK